MKNIFFTIIVTLLLIGNCIGQTTMQTYNSDPVKGSVNDDDALNSNGVKDSPRRQVPWFVEKFKVSAGFFVPVNNTNIQLDGKAGNIGTDVDFEKDLGFTKTTGTFLADFQWRSSSRSRFDLSYYGLNRSSNYTLQRTIQFGDHTYNATASINSFFNTSIYRFSYGYAILSKPNYEAGLLIGAHVARVNLGIALNSSIGSVAVNDNFGVTAPLPDFGVWGGHSFGQNWAVNAEFDYLALTIDNITGRILGYNIGATYRPFKKLSFALGYTGLNIKVDALRDKFNGHLKWGYNGPAFTAIFSFGRKGWD